MKKKKIEYVEIPSYTITPTKVIFTIPVGSVSSEKAKETLKRLLKEYKEK